MRFFYSIFPKVIVLAFFLLIGASELHAKHKTPGDKDWTALADTIKGVVTDDSGKPLSKAQVQLKGQGVMVDTKSDGSYAIPANTGDVLVISYPGFYPLMTTAGPPSALLQLHTLFLPETDSVQVLFGKKPLSSLLSAVVTISGKQIATAPVSALLPALAGQLTGLNLSFNNGQAGRDGDGQALPAGSIRGYTGQTSGGAEMLVLVDGTPRPYTSVDPAEIESITLLKDALSTVLYGMRSTPGMLLITTKKGSGIGTRLSFTAQTAIQAPLLFSKTLSAFDYATLYNKTLAYSPVTGKTPYSTSALAAYNAGSDPYIYPNVDWQSTALRKTSSLSNYNFNIQGTGTGIHYFVSLDYLKEGGLFKTSDINAYNTNADYNRYIVRSSVGVGFNKTLVLDASLFTRIQDQTQPGNNDAQGILNAVIATPALAYPIYNPNGTYGGNSSYGGNNNIYARTIQSGYALTNTKDLSFDLGLTQNMRAILKGLYLKASGSVSISSSYLTRRTRTYAVVPVSLNATGNYVYGTAIGSNADITLPTPGDTSPGSAVYRQTNTYFEGLAGYDHTFSSHSVNVKIIANQQSSLRGEALPVTYNTFGANAAYNYKQKYFAEVAGSYGSYNQFAPSNRYEPFYAFGLGWNLAQEGLIKDYTPWITNLKLRANYGKTGYVNRGTYGYFDYIQRYAGNGTFYYNGTGSTPTAGYGEVLSNYNASVEKAKKLNIGLEIGLFKNHLSLSADYFNNNLYAILVVPGSSPQLLGNNYPALNIGKERYYGTEFTTTYKNNVRDFNYFARVNLSMVQSNLVYRAESPTANPYQLVTGSPVGVFTGLTATGIFRSQAAIDAAAVPAGLAKGTDVKPGDIQYLDKNNDGIIDDLDKGPVGSTAPQLFYGATLGFSFKGVDFSVLIQGIQNRQVYLAGDYEWAFRNSGQNNAFPNNLEAYFPDNPNGTYPRLTIGTNNNNEQVSTFWLHKANFVRLKNAEIAYTLPAQWTRKIHIPTLRLFMNGENLFTLTDLDDFGTKRDPEVYGSTYPLQRTINFGVNVKL